MTSLASLTSLAVHGLRSAAMPEGISGLRQLQQLSLVFEAFAGEKVSRSLPELRLTMLTNLHTLQVSSLASLVACECCQSLIFSTCSYLLLSGLVLAASGTHGSVRCVQQTTAAAAITPVPQQSAYLIDLNQNS